METTRLHAPERPPTVAPATGEAVLPGDVAAFGEAVRKEHQRFLSALGDATARLGGGARALAGTAALQHQLTRQFLDAQRSILLRHAETQAEIGRIEFEAALDSAAQVAAARRRAAAMEAHPAAGARTALQPIATGLATWDSAPATDTGVMADIVDSVFQHREPEGASARRQLTELLDGWWTAEQQEARAKIDDAYARAAMRRHVARVEAATVATATATDAPCDAVRAGATLPERMHEILADATASRLDDVLTSLLASLELQAGPERLTSAAMAAASAPPAAAPRPLADGAIIRFESSPVIATNGSDEAFQRFWTKETPAPPVRRARWWQHAAIILPATAVSSLVVAAFAWVG